MVVENCPVKGRNANVRLRRLSRASAWVLLAGVVGFVLSGWGITQTGVIYKLTFGLVDRRLANTIHREITTPLAVFFLLHVMLNIRIALACRYPSRIRLTDAVLLVIGGGILAITIYMQYFRLGG